MSVIKIARVEGNAGRWGRGGWAEKRCQLLITGLAPQLSDDGLLAEAVSAMAGGGFAYGADHPSIIGLKLLGDVDLQAKTRSSVLANLTYKLPDEKDDENYIAVSGGSTLVGRQTNKDADGDEIVLEWQPSDERPVQRQTGMVEVLTPVETIEFSQTTTSNPAAAMRGYVGKTNNGTWQDDAAGIWLCMESRFASANGGRTWDRAMKFGRREDGWEVGTYFVLDNGKPPGNWDAQYNEGKTFKWITVYGEADFSALNLPEVYETET